MEEKRYEGIVQITSAEYRELVTDAVKATERADTLRSKNWELESKASKLEKELTEMRKRLAEYEHRFGRYMPDPNALQNVYNSVRNQED